MAENTEKLMREVLQEIRTRNDLFEKYFNSIGKLNDLFEKNFDSIEERIEKLETKK